MGSHLARHTQGSLEAWHVAVGGMGEWLGVVDLTTRIWSRHVVPTQEPPLLPVSRPTSIPGLQNPLNFCHWEPDPMGGSAPGTCMELRA